MSQMNKIIKGYKSGFIWWLINTIICNLPSKRLRVVFLKFFGVKIKGKVRFFAGFHIRGQKKIVIENGVSIGPRVLLDGRNGLIIRKNAVIAYDAIIWTMNHDYNDENFKPNGAPVEIGAYAWICSRAIVLPGITVGEGAVVASGAIVTKNVEPYDIVAGVPARVIGKRERKEYVYGYNPLTDYSHCS